MISIFSLPLQSAPRLRQAGFGTHGIEGKPSIESYRLPHLWCLHFHGYDADLEIEGEDWKLASGSVSLIPPNHRMNFRLEGLSNHIYAHFTLAPSPEAVPCPNAKYCYASADLPVTFQSDMETIVRSQPKHIPEGLFRQRAEIGLWELLWKLVELSPQAASTSTLHPALQKAIMIIDARIGRSIGVAELAREVGLSHNQLTRLFVSHSGGTVVAYIRHRRAERARYLLENSTLPIKTVAAQVGTPDLGQFNHLMRGETGVAPRAHRFRSSSSD